jgi:hypothetical protein
MIRLTKSVNAWGTPQFAEILKTEIEQLGVDQLPLQQGLTRTSQVAGDLLTAMILDVSGDQDRILAKAGIFYSGIVAGCSCADDPTPVESQPEYCEVRFDIDRATADTTIELLPG